MKIFYDPFDDDKLFFMRLESLKKTTLFSALFSHQFNIQNNYPFLETFPSFNSKKKSISKIITNSLLSGHELK